LDRRNGRVAAETPWLGQLGMLLLVVIGCYVVAYPFFALTYSDLRRYPRQLWSGYGSPHPWRNATVITYLVGGLPVLVTAWVWRTSRTRAELREAAHRSHDP
jgi:hypothetical protein